MIPSLNPLIHLLASSMPNRNGSALIEAPDLASGLNFQGSAQFLTGAVGGKSALVGDGIASLLRSPLIAAAPSWWGLVVCQAGLATVSQGVWQLEDTAGDGPAQTYLWQAQNPADGKWYLFWGQPENGFNDYTTIPFVSGTAYAFLIQASPTNCNIRSADGSSFDTNKPGSLAGNKMSLLGRTAGPFFNGGVSELAFGLGVLELGQADAILKEAL